jgi:hypothetical protein
MKVFFGGGLNESQTPDLSEAADGSFNFDLSKDNYKLVPRKPFDLKGTAPNAGEVRGLMQLVERDDTETTLVQSGNTVYRWDGASTFSSMGSCSATSKLRDTYWSLGDYLVITDLEKETVVKSWDGSTYSTLTTGLGSDLYAKYGIVHHGRVWLFNVKTSTDTPHLMVASAFENPTSYDTSQRATSGTFSTGLEAFYMLSPDLKPVNGVAKTLAGDLIISTKEGSLFKLSGTSASNYKWDNFYPSSNAVGDEAITSTGNDVMYQRQGGNIESLVATQAYGDVAADDLSRWIPNTVADVAESIAVYDQKNQKVLFFISGKVLAFFKDIFYGGAVVGDTGQKAKLSPWSVYKTTHSSNFNTSAAKYMKRPGTSVFSVYFGGPSGQIYDLNGTGTSGDSGSESIQLVRKSRFIDKKDGIDFLRHVTRGNVQYRRTNEVSFNVDLDWGDEYNNSTASVTLKGPPASDTAIGYGGSAYYSGTYYYSQGFTFANKISHQNFSAVGRGPGCFMTCSTLTTKTYQVDHVEIL